MTFHLVIVRSHPLLDGEARSARVPFINRGEGAELFSPISITIFGGLLVSTLLTLLIVPSLYSLIDDASVWTRKKLHR